MKKLMILIAFVTVNAHAFDARPQLEGESKDECIVRIGSSHQAEVEELIIQRELERSKAQDPYSTSYKRTLAIGTFSSMNSKIENLQQLQISALLKEVCGTR